MSDDLALAGCRVQPLGSYLKGLGVFRLVAEQVDKSATCRWVGETLHLRSELDAEALVAFLLERYEPSPVLAPWNSDAGFKPGSSTNTKALVAIERSDDPRLEPYRRAIDAARTVMTRPDWTSSDLSKEERKRRQVTLMRNALPDDALDWVDAAVVLRPEGPAYPLLLGSGGNLGRLDLSPNFMTRLALVIGREPEAARRSAEWLRHALFVEGSPPLRADSAGQYDPGAAGGVRAAPTGKADALTNPWDLVLLIEGALLWAAGVARRLGGSTTHASVPFSVQGSSIGHASGAAGEDLRGELWAPVWAEHIKLLAIRRLFAEGRISWSGHQARTAADAVRALSSFGVDLGLDRFVRHVVANRHGQAPLAVAVSAHPVRHRPGVDVLADLDGWSSRLQRAANARDAPAGVVQAAHLVERALFEGAEGGPGRMQAVLVAVAAAEIQVGRSERSRREGPVPPVPWLDPGRWVPLLDDQTPELRLAASMALGRDEATKDPRHGVLRFLLTMTRPEPAQHAGRNDPLGRVAWSLDPPPVPGLVSRAVDSVLTDVLALRSRAERVGADGDDDGPGVKPWFPCALDTRAGDPEALAAGLLDLDRLGELLAGLVLLRPEPGAVDHQWQGTTTEGVSPGWRLLAPFYARRPVSLSGRQVRLRPLTRWAALLAAGRGGAVFGEAFVRLRMAHLRPVPRSPRSIGTGTSDTLLAASLLASPPRADVQRALDHVIDPIADQGAVS